MPSELPDAGLEDADVLLSLGHENRALEARHEESGEAVRVGTGQEHPVGPRAGKLMVCTDRSVQ